MNSQVQQGLASTPIGGRLASGLALSLMLAMALLVFTRPDVVPQADSLRHTNMALNLLHHGVLSAERVSVDRAPEPALLEGGPLVAVELAIVAMADSTAEDVFVCASQNKAQVCQGAVFGLKFVHFLELVVTFAFLWLIGLRVFASGVVAFVMCAIALLAREVFEYSNLALSEQLYMMLYVMFAWAFLRLGDQQSSITSAAFAGLCLGLTILVKPAVAAVLILAPVILLARAWLEGWQLRPSIRLSGAFLVAASIVVGPWVVRNWQVAGVVALADPFYLEAALSHRLGYNAMSWKEWLVGWIFYLPDFGDSLAEALFAKENYLRLGSGADGYYEYGKRVLRAQARAHTHPDPAVGYLIKAYVLAQPVKFIMVSLLLFWRGIFLSSYWGLLAVICLPFALVGMPPAQRKALAYIGLPALAIAAVNAAISVSIPRYNVALIPLYAIVLTWTLLQVAVRARRWLFRPRGSERHGP